MYWKGYDIEGLKSKFLFKFVSKKFLMTFLDTGNLWFARSDTFGNKETLAFWDTYAKSEEDRRKFAIRFDRERFVEHVENKAASLNLAGVKSLVHGRVKYKNLIGATKNQLDELRVKYPAFRKEYAFAYEKEYRFDILMKEEFAEKGYNYNLGNIREIPFKILVNPLLDDTDYVRCLKDIKAKKFKDSFMPSVLTGWLKPKLWGKVMSDLAGS